MNAFISPFAFIRTIAWPGSVTNHTVPPGPTVMPSGVTAPVKLCTVRCEAVTGAAAAAGTAAPSSNAAAASTEPAHAGTASRNPRVFLDIRSSHRLLPGTRTDQDNTADMPHMAQSPHRRRRSGRPGLPGGQSFARTVPLMQKAVEPGQCRCR